MVFVGFNESKREGYQKKDDPRDCHAENGIRHLKCRIRRNASDVTCGA
jgi:hypothetical protein